MKDKSIKNDTTKKAIADSMISIMSKKKFEKITIKEITDHAKSQDALFTCTLKPKKMFLNT